MNTIAVEASSASCNIEIGRGALARARALLEPLGAASGVYTLSSRTVWKHCGAAVLRGLGRHTAHNPILFDDREQAKTLQTVECICRALVSAGADRRALLVAVGGGVVGDVVGLVAASYLRGVRLVHVPTTLLAQIDSSIGGKTGVNLPEGKNLVGAFYQPSLVITDPNLLSTLPARQYRSGLYEVIKYGILGDRRLFEFLEHRMPELVNRDRASLDWILPRCIAAKAAIVSRDERESGPREALNLGHTFAHALETLTHYRRFLHGEAVGWGLIAAARLAVSTGRLTKNEAERISRLVLGAGTLPPLPVIPPARWLDGMRADKKTRSGHLRFILPRAIGKVEIAQAIREKLVCRVISELGKRER